MEVILTGNVDKLGKAGQTVKVKDGFARNFLMPNNLAVPLTPGNLKALERQEQKKILQLDKIKEEVGQLKEKLTNLSLTLPVLAEGEEEKIYGSISSADISAVLKEEGFDIDKSCIVLDEPIKSLGIYEIPVKLHSEVSVKIKIWVVKK